jgi:hypothetical protein
MQNALRRQSYWFHPGRSESEPQMSRPSAPTAISVEATAQKTTKPTGGLLTGNAWWLRWGDHDQETALTNAGSTERLGHEGTVVWRKGDHTCDANVQPRVLRDIGGANGPNRQLRTVG